MYVVRLALRVVALQASKQPPQPPAGKQGRRARGADAGTPFFRLLADRLACLCVWQAECDI